MVPPVEDVLVIGDEVGLVGLFHQNRGVPDQDIGADQFLDGI